MADSIGGIPRLILPSGEEKPDPLQPIARRLFALVRSHPEWWREAVRRWANDPPLHGDDGVLPVPFPETLTPEERIAILAAIHDAYATDVARIDPWPSREMPPIESADAIPGEYQLAIRYAILLRDRVPKLCEHWDTHEAAIEMFIAEIERDISAEGSRVTQSQNGDLIDRLLAGPDQVELTRTELAMLEAHLQQPVSFSAIQLEKKATGESPTNVTQNKLKLIRDYNRNLQAAAAGVTAQPVESTPKRRGRKKADYETEQREAQLAADWVRAKEAGVYKPQFAKDNGMKLAELEALLTRVRKRKARAY